MLSIPFHLRGHAGQVAVLYEVNRDPAHWGFGPLQLPFDISLVEGFPVCRATIEYAGRGYHAFMGWLQVVTVTETDGRSWASIDIAPMFWETDSPFSDFGYLPTMFDAPGPNPPRSDETWVAETFLAMAPDVARSRRVQALLGFRWGYDLRAGRASSLPVDLASETDWQRCAGVLRDGYPNWEFASRFAPE